MHILFPFKNLLIVYKFIHKRKRNKNNPRWEYETTAWKMKVSRRATQESGRNCRIGPAVPRRLDSRDRRAGQQ